MWFIGVEVEQDTSAPPPKKILDPPLYIMPNIMRIWGTKSVYIQTNFLLVN